MKKFVILVMCVLGMPVITNIKAQDLTWQKPATQAWQGKQDTIAYWYTLDAEGRLAWTSDNQKWTIVPQPLWSDYEGKQFKIIGTELMISSDTGKTWTKSTTRYWRGSDGMWYGFDANWTLWTGGNGNNPPLGVVGSSSPYGGTDAYTGTNVNGETKGVNGNQDAVLDNKTTIVTPTGTNTNSGGTVSGAQQNNMAKPTGGNTNTITPK